MKKIISAVLLFAMICILPACGNGKKSGSDADRDYINTAIAVVNKKWEEIYNKGGKSDKTVEIFNTRVIHIKENDIAEFEDVEAVVEFDIFSDYYGTAPYYTNIQKFNSVVIYKDGSSTVTEIFKLYRNKYFITDFSDIIEDIKDYGTEFNTGSIKTVKPEADDEKYITDAKELVFSKWHSYYLGLDASASNDGTLKIVNTKLIKINEKSEYTDFREYFANIEAIVEFELYTDYYGSGPYYENAGKDNTVIFYRGGNVEVTTDYIMNVVNKTYDYDLSDLFSGICEFGSVYNDTFDIKVGDISK